MKSALMAVLSFCVGISTFSSRAEAACNWNLEIFKSKISDACQAEFMGKLTDEQDKIYSRRMFKDWNLPKGTEVSVEPGFLQVSNTETGELYQVAWMSLKPMILWMDGVVVTDASNDTSIFRRIEKMYKKAHEEVEARRDPVRTFLFGNEAYADSTSPNVALTNLYHVNGYTGTAADFLTAQDHELTGLFGNDEWSNHSWWFGSQKSVSCTGTKITDYKTTIEGKSVTVKQLKNSEFEITGLVPEHTVLVDMGGSAVGVLAGSQTSKKHKHKHRSYLRKNPCDGNYSVDSEEQCKDAWTDYVAQNPEIKSKYDGLVAENGGASSVNYAKDVTCGKLYDAGSARDKCINFIHDRVPATGYRFGEESARFKICNSSGGACGKHVSSSYLFTKQDDFKSEVETKKYDEEKRAYEKYREALSQAGVDESVINSLCSAPDLDTVPSCRRYHGFKNAHISDANRKKIESAYRGLKDPEDDFAMDEGSNRAHEIGKRMLGVMMLSDCCTDSVCRDKLRSQRAIDLKKGDGTAQ